MYTNREYIDLIISIVIYLIPSLSDFLNSDLVDLHVNIATVQYTCNKVRQTER